MGNPIDSMYRFFDTCYSRLVRKTENSRYRNHGRGKFVEWATLSLLIQIFLFNLYTLQNKRRYYFLKLNIRIAIVEVGNKVLIKTERAVFCKY